MIPKYNWKNQYYNLQIRRFPKGYIINIDGVEKIYFGNKDEVYELMVEDYPILKEILETPKQEGENEQ